ncbi:MAG: hypothetical protein ABRQ38_28005 [Candidatus Eremiobacterota bacterium]
MPIIYLDYNCFQRGFDDHGQIRIKLEALACQEIFLMAEENKVTLIWSFMHEDENILCPFIDRKIAIKGLSILCKLSLSPEEEIYKLAKYIQQATRITSKDAVHLACAVYSKSDFFLSCDDRLIKQSQKLNLQLCCMNPVEYIREVI